MYCHRRRQHGRHALVVCMALAAVCAAAAEIAPSNLPVMLCRDSIAGDVAITSTAQIDTDSGCTDSIGQSAGPDLCVIRYHSLTVAPGATLTLVGSRAAVLTAQTDMLIGGTLLVTAGGSLGSGNNGFPAAGGGGGGGSTSGSPGGTAFQSPGSGGLGGAPVSNVTLVPLWGGSRGGSGGGGGGAAGGSGGGALELVACGTLTVAGTINAGGAGGSGGQPISGPIGGGGGGAGGGILLEGDNVMITGEINANGGGGGGGGTTSAAGLAGSAGGDSLLAAAGGPAAGSSAGHGGSGGNGLTSPLPGGNASSSSGAAGGGGGAPGAVRINACTSMSSDASLISPPATAGNNCSDVIFEDGFELPL